MNIQRTHDLAVAVNAAVLRSKGNTIGLLAEKTLHNALKLYFCPDISCHEIKHKGFVADIYIEESPPHIIEIQTKQVYKLKRKLDAYGEDADITIVLPMFAKKLIRWIDPETGDISEPHKSTKPKNIYSALAELYGIREYILKDNITVCVLLLNGVEYKLLDGYGDTKKRRATKYDIVPEEVEEELWLSERSDYEVFCPPGLGKEFTAMEFARATRLPIGNARNAMLMLKHLGMIEECGRDGRYKLWSYTIR